MLAQIGISSMLESVVERSCMPHNPVSVTNNTEMFSVIMLSEFGECFILLF